MQRRSSGGGSVKKRSSGGGSVKKRSSGGGSKISYGGGSMQRSSSGGGSVKKRSSGGGSVTIYGMQCSNAIRSPEALTPPRRSDIERLRRSSISSHHHRRSSIAFHSLFLVLFSGEGAEEASRCGPNGLSRG
ncbi:hypothetical protein F2Q70_00002667 [Brassica cretica]|uniref:Uncharacterized protein n=1 Tax=Brassica cretica TaxID=69181 RepID=A0A8S9J2A8_BRACR|nr:hypothetical protein F2Q68_00020612 [Brassica cretica]KAF2576194.1 hypothetical protein F2Q70_00002667 [Brassica cretica]